MAPQASSGEPLRPLPSRFPHRQAPLTNRFRYWLLRIAVNEARQHHRRSRPAVSLDNLAEVFAEARRATVDQEASRREFELELEQALETMAEPLKTPLVLHYYQSLSLAEVRA